MPWDEMELPGSPLASALKGKRQYHLAEEIKKTPRSTQASSSEAVASEGRDKKSSVLEAPMLHATLFL
jgi:hypothetical protein